MDYIEREECSIDALWIKVDELLQEKTALKEALRKAIDSGFCYCVDDTTCEYCKLV